MSFASESWPLPIFQNFFQDSEVHFVLKKEPNILWAYYKHDQIFSVFCGPSPVQNPNSKAFGALYFMGFCFPSIWLFSCSVVSIWYHQTAPVRLNSASLFFGPLQVSHCAVQLQGSCAHCCLRESCPLNLGSIHPAQLNLAVLPRRIYAHQFNYSPSVFSPPEWEGLVEIHKVCYSLCPFILPPQCLGCRRPKIYSD